MSLRRPPALTRGEWVATVSHLLLLSPLLLELLHLPDLIGLVATRSFDEPRLRPLTTIAELLTQKQHLLSRLEEYPGPNERGEIERHLDKIDAELNAVDNPDRL